MSTASGERFCVDVSAVDDSIAEGTEQFELYFEPITPSGSANVVAPETVCVNIEDNDSTYECYNIIIVGRYVFM